MANGQQLAEQNHAAFLAWSASKTDDDFKSYIYRCSLSRKEIATECGFSKSALVQNPAIKSSLAILEEGLRVRGVLPPLKETLISDDNNAAQRDRDASKNRTNNQRLNTLEQKNAALAAENKALKEKLLKLNIMDEFLVETGRLPR